MSAPADNGLPGLADHADSDALLERVLFDTAHAADPYPSYDRLRASAPVHRWRETPIWAVTSHEHCHRALRDPKLGKGTSDLGALLRGDPVAAMRSLPDVVTSGSIVFMNPPEHTRIRGFLNRMFTPRRVEGLRPFVEKVTDELLDELDAAGGGDLVEQFAFRIPIDVIAELVGVPRADRDEVRRLVAAAVRVFDPLADNTSDEAAEAARQLGSYFSRLARSFKRAPADNLLSDLIAARDSAGGREADRLTNTELISSITLLFGAGFESTAYVVATGLHTLLHHREAFRALGRAEDRSPIAARTAEECLRYEPAFQLVFRSVLEPVELGGERLAAGDWALVFLAAANRDPAVFANPHRFDTERSPNYHLTFSSGVHHCLGAALARLELEVAFHRFARRFPDAEVVAEPEWRVTPFRKVDALHVRVR